MFELDLIYPGQNNNHRLSVSGHMSRYYESNMVGHPDGRYPAEGGELLDVRVVLSIWYRNKLLARYIKPSKIVLEWIEKEVRHELEIMSR